MPAMSEEVIAAAAKEGTTLMHAVGDVFFEVSEYNGKIYMSARRWFKAENGNWYRTKNGLSLDFQDFLAVLRMSHEANDFCKSRLVAMGKLEDHNASPF